MRVTGLIHNGGKYLLISIYLLPTHPTHNFTHKNGGNLDTLPGWPKKLDHNRPARCAGQLQSVWDVQKLWTGCMATDNGGGPENRGTLAVIPQNHRSSYRAPCERNRLKGGACWCKSHNLFLVGSNGDEVQSTRLIVSDVPLSSSNKDIEDTLLKLGCKLLSPRRDEKGLLTQWKTGRRYIFIAVPASSLQRDIKIGIFNAKLYHREQKSQRPVLSCYNCFERGHVRRECPNLMRCRVCRQEGHKQGYQVCALNMTSQVAATDFPSPPWPPPQLPQAPRVIVTSLPHRAVLGQSHQQDGSGQEEDCSMPPSTSDPKKKKKKKEGDKNILKGLLSPEAPASKEKLEVDRDSDSSWSLSYRLHVDWPG